MRQTLYRIVMGMGVVHLKVFEYYDVSFRQIVEQAIKLNSVPPGDMRMLEELSSHSTKELHKFSGGAMLRFQNRSRFGLHDAHAILFLRVRVLLLLVILPRELAIGIVLTGKVLHRGSLPILAPRSLICDTFQLVIFRPWWLRAEHVTTKRLCTLVDMLGVVSVRAKAAFARTILVHFLAQLAVSLQIQTHPCVVNTEECVVRCTDGPVGSKKTKH